MSTLTHHDNHPNKVVIIDGVEDLDVLLEAVKRETADQKTRVDDERKNRP